MATLHGGITVALQKSIRYIEFINRTKQSMGFWYPGMHGVYDPKSLTIPKFAPSPILFTCELCRRNFLDIEKLRRHRFEQHPLRQPTLFLHGRAVSGTPLKVQSAISPSDVILEDVTKCWLNNKPIPLDSLRLLLADSTNSFHKIRLSNGEAHTDLALNFQVAKEKDLEAVESALLRLAMGQKLSLEAIGNFIRECRELTTGMLYCDGISHYLYGVMAKEQLTGTGLDAESYLPRYAQAVDQLTDINRPIARSLRALISFHFNHFRDAESLAPAGNLQSVARAFAGLLDGMTWEYEEPSGTPIQDAITELLTDQSTLEIVRDASQRLPSLITKAPLLEASLAKITPGFDRSKRLLLTIESLSYQEEPNSIAAAKKLARELSPQSFASTWFEVTSNRLKTL